MDRRRLWGELSGVPGGPTGPFGQFAAAGFEPEFGGAAGAEFAVLDLRVPTVAFLADFKKRFDLVGIELLGGVNKA